MLGEYNFTNIISALTIAKYFDVDVLEASQKIQDYTPTNNRSQIKKIGDNTIILDAYNANPTSMKAAIESFDKMNGDNKTLILGDMFELGSAEQEEHQSIVSLCEKLGFKNVFLCGKAFEKTTSEYQKFNNIEELKKNFQINTYTDTLILVKGSRSMKLETLFD
jgi:UDP-N-acetylmuramoyl-tripeptide--D-alanyl-D-alanine ligase